MCWPLDRMGRGKRMALTGEGLPDPELPQASCPMGPGPAISWAALTLCCPPRLALPGPMWVSK